MKKAIFSLAIAAGLLGASPAQLHGQDSPKTVALETIGVQGGTLLYNTYCLIGAMHDGYIVDAWKSDLVNSVLDEQIDLMTTVSNQYQELVEAQYLSETDSLFMLRMKTCCGLLQDEARYLKDYVNDGTEDSRLKYSKARDDAWDLIEELLGLNKNAYSGSAGRLEKSGSR